MRTRVKAPRRGASLVEMILIIGSMTVIFAVCGIFLHLLLRVDRSGRAALTEGVTVSRLGRQFRDDVRAASGAKPVEGKAGSPAGFGLTLPGGRAVAYTNAPGFLERVETASDKFVRREGYRLDPTAAATFAVKGDLAVLTVGRKKDDAGESAVACRIVATLGKDLALSNPKGAK
jgi:hypothetical protein